MASTQVKTQNKLPIMVMGEDDIRKLITTQSLRNNSFHQSTEETNCGTTTEKQSEDKKPTLNSSEITFNKVIKIFWNGLKQEVGMEEEVKREIVAGNGNEESLEDEKYEESKEDGETEVDEDNKVEGKAPDVFVDDENFVAEHGFFTLKSQAKQKRPSMNRVASMSSLILQSLNEEREQKDVGDSTQKPLGIRQSFSVRHNSKEKKGSNKVRGRRHSINLPDMQPTSKPGNKNHKESRRRRHSFVDLGQKKGIVQDLKHFSLGFSEELTGIEDESQCAFKYER